MKQNNSRSRGGTAFRHIISTGILTAGLLAVLLLASCASTGGTVPTQLTVAEISDLREVGLRFLGLPEDISSYEFSIEPDLEIGNVERNRNAIILSTDRDFQLNQDYTVTVRDTEGDFTASVGVKTDKLEDIVFNNMYSDKPMGYRLEDGVSAFRLFVPRGKAVELHLFDAPGEEAREVIPMENDGNQVFEAFIDGELYGTFYGYSITERYAQPTAYDLEIPADTVFPDPYSYALASSNDYPQFGLTLIYDRDEFDWQGTEALGLDIADAIIMEAHLRDLSTHPSAEAENPGTYLGVVDAARGGMNWLKDLGVNAVEFLPLQDFNNIEAPYKEDSLGYFNTWNGYGENYWGYMTFNFFAPESYYASDGSLEPGTWNGTDGRQVDEMKTMVRELHKNGIAVLMDVVYNHTSKYDNQPLMLIDRDFYYKDQDGTGTGNELESRRKMARKMILDSVRYWMEEYHIDGFRFDLAASHDPETIRAIYEMATEINPEVMLIAEPWGGEGATSAEEFLELGWSKWNSEIRDAIRSQNRPTQEGDVFVLGETNGAKNLMAWWGDINPAEPHQYVQYIESHDDATLGDNLRIQSGEYSFYNEDGSINRIEDIREYTELTPDLLDAHRIAAASLFFSQGPIMMHLGQEWARGKITPDLEGNPPEITENGGLGASSDNIVYLTPSPNSYSADNNTNYIDFDLAQVNAELTDYYRGLIELRKSEELLGAATSEQLNILESPNAKALGVEISGELYGFVNASREESAPFTIPEGSYGVVVNKTEAGSSVLETISGGAIEVEPASALFLKKQ
ncbi:alpha-amylase family glycosyl hydrolase [Salinispira pacifica]|uniref:Glycogen debranching enzyme n=1 Tax=Salinispira pacifica TaxID=1307761 RepID=V5WDX5_9SPIO|nr:alpha-amylase family glycosyl hydrolase [Salinispira pacifica]AHC13830.1 Glycogen debranching enzyme [Salinispira pacifica]